MKTKRFVSTLLALLLICGLPLSAFAAEYDLAQGSVTVNASESGQTVTHGTNTPVEDSAPVITQSNSETPTTNTVTINAEGNATANVTIQDVNIVISDPEGSPQNHSGKAAVTVNVADNAVANVTLDGVTIDVSETGDNTDPQYTLIGEAAVQIMGNGDVTMELDGSNTVQSGVWRAGVEKNDADSSGKLTITDETGTDGSLNATGGRDGAGIGGGFEGNLYLPIPSEKSNGSNINITGGTVTATGGNAGAGIGGGFKGSGSDITISGSAEVTANGGSGGSGIGGGMEGSGSDITISGSDITISGSAEVTATGGNLAAGIGGGSNGSGSDITITGSAEVTAKGGDSGAGIGGGHEKTGSNITVSGDAQVKAQGGNSIVVPDPVRPYAIGAGAAIGDGGFYKLRETDAESLKGRDVTPNTDDLNEGWVATYAPGTTDLDNATPISLTSKDASNVTGAQPIAKQEPTCTEDGHRAGFMVGGKKVGGEPLPATGHSFTNYVSDNNATYTADGTKTAKCDHCNVTDTIPDPGSKLVREETAQTAALYRVIDQDGKALACKTERKVGVLTITVDADYAALTGKLGGIQTLKAQGVDTIVFVTNNATSTFALADLLSQGSTGDSYTLVHDGDAVTFTLGEAKTDISDILAKP